MSELAITQDNCSICGSMLEAREITWDTYEQDTGKYLSHVVGYRCGNCGAVFCGKGHRRELGFKFFRGGAGYKNSPCTQCGESLAMGRVLIAAGVQAEEQGVLFQRRLEEKLAKHEKYTRIFLYWAGISTALTCLLLLSIPYLGEAGTALAPIWGLIAIGVFTWPACPYHHYQRVLFHHDPL